jgi:hypothetical protein
MFVGRWIGWLFLLSGLAVLVRDLIAWADSGRFAPIVLGQLWFDLAPASLNLAQAVIQRYIHPALWDPAIQRLLLLWAFPVLILIGFLLIAAFRPRESHRRRR